MDSALLIQLGVFILSLITLVLGADLALEGSEKVGKKMGIPPFVIGLLLVGFGTSLPELFVSHLALLGGKPEIAFGNLIGSNLSNILLILGISALLVSVPLKDKLHRFQISFHLMMTLGMGLVFYFYRPNMIFACFCMVFFVGYLFKTLQEGKEACCEDIEVEEFSLFSILKMLIGFAMLYFGGDWLVSSASSLGKILGVSEFVISAILLAFGTSLPELITSLIAIKKEKSTDLIFGNIIGSNIFNFVLILGSTGFYQVNSNSSYLVEFTILTLLSLIFLVLHLLKMQLRALFGLASLIIYVALVYYWLI